MAIPPEWGLQARTGLRTPLQGYGVGGGMKQHYAGMERDEGSGVDHAWWRTYESESGRWMSADPYNGSMSVGDPQSLNRYSYVGNDPANSIDPLFTITGFRTIG